MAQPSTIAIDGPAASGKSTIGALLAERLGYLYFDTGVMYRAVTWVALEQRIAITDEARVTALAEELQIDVSRPTVDDGRQYTVLANGQDVTWVIRTPQVDYGVSPVSTYAGVRAALTAQQRRIGRRGQVVMVGRDIGTVVLPDADLKIYLDATLDKRVQRRYREVVARLGAADYATIVESVRRRDEIDSSRELAPLQPAQDGVVIDTTLLTIDEVLERVMALVDKWHGCDQECPREDGGSTAKAPGGVISAVEPHSLADEIGLRPGDRLVAINDHPLRDIIDVRFYSAEEMLALAVECGGELRLIEVERDYDQDLGLTFAHPTFDADIRRCTNNCDFCFVKQNAPGMRRSLYVKDDDYRYSFLFGSFVTLTNLTGDDWARLEEQRLSPLYVSVHATDLALRRRFLARKDAPDVVEQLQRLADLHIQVHAQVVLVPGLNDGEHLARTVADLTALYGKPVLSVSVVPVGLTRYHRGSCRTYSPGESRAVLEQVEPWRAENRNKRGCPFVYPSDEWYLVAGWEVPQAGDYDGFPQVENGVGMVRLLLDEWEGLRPSLRGSELKPATLVCGTLIAPLLGHIIEEVNALTGARWQLIPVTNHFFGPLTTVSGLLTGQDVIAALEEHSLGEVVLLPKSMLSGGYGAAPSGDSTTLDDMTLADISARLGVPVETAGTLTEALAALGRKHHPTAARSR